MFFGAFWHSFGLGGLGISNLDNILKKENLSIEDLMDEDNIVNEIKNGP